MSPASNDPVKRGRQLANLKRGGNPPPAAPGLGNDRAKRHGAYAVIAAERLEAKTLEVFEAMAADAPMRDADGGLPAADSALVQLLAEAMCRRDDVSDYIRRRGFEDGDGNLRVAVDIEQRLRREVREYLADLGCTPAARARLGVDVAKAVDLATAWSQPASTDPTPDVVDGQVVDGTTGEDGRG